MTFDQFVDSLKCSASAAAKWYEPFKAAMLLDAIDTPLRQAHFLAQVGHESLGLRYVQELWGPTSQQLKYDPRSGSSVAESLGNTQPGDGYRFLGRGFIQVTGRANYARVGLALGTDLISNPEALALSDLPARSAVWFWSSRNLNTVADRDDIEAVTKKINGGTNGLADRKMRLRDAKKAFGLPN